MSGSRRNIPTGPTPRVAQLLDQAAELVAHGHTLRAAAEKLGASYDAIRNGRQRHPQVAHEVDRRHVAEVRRQQAAAADEILASVRAAVGTTAVLDDPKRYFELATLAADWAQTRYREALFPSNGEQTLDGFFRHWYVPNRLFDATAGTKAMYEVALRRFYLVVGPVPLKEITQEHLRIFRNFLLGTVKPVTAGGYLRQVQTILIAAGPPAPYVRDAAGILDRVPYVRRPKAEVPAPKIVSLDRISAMYRAADQMTCPQLQAVSAAAWWRGVLVVAYNLGIRAGTLRAMRWDFIDPEQRLVTFPPEVMKSARYLMLPLNEVVLRHLDPLRAEGAELVFPWPKSHSYFWTALTMLQVRSGLKKRERFGLHRLRKTLATELWKHSPPAAQLMLGHANGVTEKHYVCSLEVIRPALETLPQPPAFVEQ